MSGEKNFIVEGIAHLEVKSLVSAHDEEEAQALVRDAVRAVLAELGDGGPEFDMTFKKVVEA